MRKLHYLPLCISILALAGCNDKNLSVDEKEERNPLVKTGVAFMEQNQWDDAIQAFNDALQNDPSMAKPHLDLAQLYQQYKSNYVYAIYHYDRYLELRPGSEKASLIQKLREKARQDMILSAPEVQDVVARARQLMQENNALKTQLAAAEQPAQTQPDSQPTSTPAATADIKPAATAEPQPAQPTASHQLYTVASGDTLTKIATKFYGDPAKWDTIYQANKDSLSSPRSLKVGQTLVIPSLGN